MRYSLSLVYFTRLMSRHQTVFGIDFLQFLWILVCDSKYVSDVCGNLVWLIIVYCRCGITHCICTNHRWCVVRSINYLFNLHLGVVDKELGPVCGLR